MKIFQAGLFAKQVKKLHKNEKTALDEGVKIIAANPNIGERKKADFQDVTVYKYKIKSQQYLLAYLHEEDKIILLAHGVHENFYRSIRNIYKKSRKMKA